MSSLFDKLFKTSTFEKQRFGMLYQSFLKSKRRTRFQTEKSYRIKSNTPLIDKSKFLYDIPDSMIFPNTADTDETEENADVFLKEFGELLDTDYYLPESVLNLLGLGHLIENQSKNINEENHPKESEKSKSVNVSKNNEPNKHISTVTTVANISTTLNVNNAKSDSGNQKIMDQINSLKRKYNSQNETPGTHSPICKNVKKNINSPSNSKTTNLSSKPQSPNFSKLKSGSLTNKTTNESNTKSPTSTNIKDSTKTRSDSKIPEKIFQKDQVINYVCSSPRGPSMNSTLNFPVGHRMNYTANFPRGQIVNNVSHFPKNQKMNNEFHSIKDQRMNNISHYPRSPNVSNMSNFPKCQSMNRKSSQESGTKTNSNTSSTSNELEIVYCETETPTKKSFIQKKIEKFSEVKKRNPNTFPPHVSRNVPMHKNKSLQSQDNKNVVSKCSTRESSLNKKVDSEDRNNNSSNHNESLNNKTSTGKKKKKKRKNPQSNNDFMRDIHSMLSHVLEEIKTNSNKAIDTQHLSLSNADRHVFNHNPTMVLTNDFLLKNYEAGFSNSSHTTLTGKEFIGEIPMAAYSSPTDIQSSTFDFVSSRTDVINREEIEVDFKPEVNVTCNTTQTISQDDAILSNNSDAAVSDSSRRPRIFLKDPSLLFEVPEAHLSKESNEKVKEIDNALTTNEKSPVLESVSCQTSTLEFPSIVAPTRNSPEHSNQIIQSTASQSEEDRIVEPHSDQQIQTPPENINNVTDLRGEIEIDNIGSSVHSQAGNDLTESGSNNLEERDTEHDVIINDNLIIGADQAEPRNNDANLRNKTGDDTETENNSEIEKESIGMKNTDGGTEKTVNDHMENNKLQNDLLYESLKINKELQKSLIRQEAQLTELIKSKKTCEKCTEVTDILFLTGISAEQKICILQSLHSLSQQ